MMDFVVKLSSEDHKLSEAIVTDVRPKMVYEDNKVTDRQEEDGHGHPVYRLHFMVMGNLFGASDFWANYTDTTGVLRDVSAPFALKKFPIVFGHTYGARGNNVTFSVPGNGKGNRLQIDHEINGAFSDLVDDDASTTAPAPKRGRA